MLKFLMLTIRQERGFERYVAILAVVCLLLGMPCVLVFFPPFTFLDLDFDAVKATGFILFFFGAFSSTALKAWIQSKDEIDTEERIRNVEQEARESEAPKAAWDLARIKLESYLDRNLAQVKSIFWLTVVVMIVGFGLVIVGVVIVYNNPEQLAPSIVAACTGILTNFIGVTFLVIYRNTMERARDYVTVLERINAVGMAVQIAQTIDDERDQLRDETKAELSRTLLEIYQMDEKAKK